MGPAPAEVVWVRLDCGAPAAAPLYLGQLQLGGAAVGVGINPIVALEKSY